MTLSSFLPRTYYRVQLFNSQNQFRSRNVWQNFVFKSNTLPLARLVSTDSKFAIPRELPDIKDNRSKYLAYTIAGILFWGGILSVAFSYQKQHTSIVKSTIFIVKFNEEAIKLLGNNIEFSSSWPWIHGDINHLKGRVDISYSVSGSKGTGTVSFKSVRKNNQWTAYHFALQSGNQEISLLSDDTIDNIRFED